MKKLIPILCILLMFSCKKNKTFLDQEVLFKIGIGVEEDQINAFDSKDYLKDEFYFKNNTFYVTDAGSYKTMTFTPYGDLIGLFYNPDKNPNLSLTSKITSKNSISSRVAVPFNFEDPGKIAITQNGDLLVQDKVEPIREEENGTFIEKYNVIRIFNSQNKYVGDLKEEGINGKPFTYIHDLSVHKNKIFVLTKLPLSSYKAYIFDSNFKLLKGILIEPKKLPTKYENAILNIENVFLSEDGDLIYIKVDVYNADKPVSKVESFTNLPSYIYSYNTKNGRIEEIFSLPEKSNNNGDIYYFIGSDYKDRMFFMLNEQNKNASLLVTEKNGKIIFEKELNINFTNTIFGKFFVSKEGILCYFAGFEDRFEMRWWRSDKSIKRFVF